MFVSSPTVISYLISKPTSRKNTAISTSLMTCESGIVACVCPNTKPTSVCQKWEKASETGEFATTSAAIAAKEHRTRRLRGRARELDELAIAGLMALYFADVDAPRIGVLRTGVLGCCRRIVSHAFRRASLLCAQVRRNVLSWEIQSMRRQRIPRGRAFVALSLK